jgi:hypothetical protein
MRKRRGKKFGELFAQQSAPVILTCLAATQTLSDA